MFSGQGSQHYGMARQLFEEHPGFRASFLEMDDLVRQLTGASVCETLYSSGHTPSTPFVQLRMTHPAIFMVEYALARCLIAEYGTPDLVLGASLGSFAAATVAGCIEPERALTAIVKQAELFERRCEPGHMVAILDSPRVIAEGGLEAHCELAASNFANHFAVAVPAHSLSRLTSYLRSRASVYQTLDVLYAFHSKWIDAAADEYRMYLKHVPTRAARIPIVCCASARSLTHLPPTWFWDIARQPIRFGDAIRLLEQGQGHVYIDAGPSGTLATLTKYALPAGSSSKMHSVLARHGKDLAALHAVAQLMDGPA
jgi:acyl transferase domain-containing protein